VEFDAIHIVIYFVTAGLGFIYFRYGRSQQEMSYVLAGAALMGYPYVVSSVAGLILVGLALAASPFLYRRFG
jgi:hypothetical protein